MGTIARQITYSGRVQGVGFRYRTIQCATGLAVTGYVKNLPNGDVEVVAEGAEPEIAELCRRIGAAMAGNIETVSTREIPVSEKYSEFTVHRI